MNKEREKVNKLSNELNIIKQENLKLNNQLNSVKQLYSTIESLKKELNSKNIEIKNLKDELLSKRSSRLEDIKPGEKIIAINFISTDQKINNHAIACKNTDIFVKLEEELYEEYPEYKEVNTYFTVGGNIIKRFKSIQDNNIRNQNKILLNVYE